MSQPSAWKRSRMIRDERHAAKAMSATDRITVAEIPVSRVRRMTAAVTEATSLPSSGTRSSSRSINNRPMLKAAEEDSNYEDDVSRPNDSLAADSSNATSMEAICYTCYKDECEGEDVPTCTGYACFSTHVTEGGSLFNGREYFKKGCTDSHSFGFHCKSQSFRGKNPNAGKYVTDCCRSNFCNNESSAIFLNRLSSPAAGPSASLPDHSPSTYPLLLCVLPLVAFITILIVLLYMRKKKASNKQELVTHNLTAIPIRRDPEAAVDGEELASFIDSNSCDGESPLKAVPVGDSTLRELGLDHGLSSGSGSGLPQLSRLTFVREIEKGVEIGRGRYSSVFKGKWRGDDVAIKVFPTHRESFFTRECDMYTTPLFRHPNILGFFDGDPIPSMNGEIELWLVTVYHEQRSLFEFLKQHSLSLRDAHSIIRSASAGLMHLHLHLHTGTTSKPGIAHRDLKTKNLLMKACKDRHGHDVWEVVIADFGLAVRQTDVVNGLRPETMGSTAASASGELESKEKFLRVGTKRYMSPEILDGSICNYKDLFSVMTQSDIYSFALVVWETLRRVELTNESGRSIVFDYLMAYEDIVPSDPSFEEMRKVVVTDGHRPPFPAEWTNNGPLSLMKDIMRESWKTKPESRLTIKTIYNKLIAIPIIGTNA